MREEKIIVASQLVEKLLAYIDQFNKEGKVFQWTKPAAAIFRSRNYQAGH